MPIHPSLLEQFALLRHLSESTLAELATHSSLKQLARREVMVDRESPPMTLFFLLEGRLQAVDFTLDGKEVGLYFLEEGQYFGEVAMFDGLNHSEIIIASKKSQVVLVPNRAIRPEILKHPQTTEAIAMGLASRLRQQTLQRQILSINNPLQRVCAQLLLLIQNSNKETSGSHSMQVIEHAPTHQELAMMANLSRETVTRVFQALQSQGAIDRQSEGLIVNTEKMKILANHAE
jgi:CRP/FNR family transcriptional regulator, cyclic AMP receptor protein